MNLDASSSLKNLTCENAIFQHLLWFVYSFIWFLWVLFLLLLYFAAMTCPKLAHSVCLRPGMPPFMGPGMPPMPPGCAVCSVSFYFKAVTLYNEHFHFRHVNNFRSSRVKPYEFNIIVCSSVTPSLLSRHGLLKVEVSTWFNCLPGCHSPLWVLRIWFHRL